MGCPFFLCAEGFLSRSSVIVKALYPRLLPFLCTGIIAVERTISSSSEGFFGDVGRSWGYYRFRSSPSL